MSNWHIQFEVTGKYLDEALTVIHGLRAVSNLSVQPLKKKENILTPAKLNRRPSAKSTNGERGAQRDELVEIVRAKKRANTLDVFNELSQRGHDTTMKKVASNLGNAQRAGLLKRVGRATFSLTAKGEARNGQA